MRRVVNVAATPKRDCPDAGCTGRRDMAGVTLKGTKTLREASRLHAVECRVWELRRIGDFRSGPAIRGNAVARQHAAAESDAEAELNPF